MTTPPLPTSAAKEISEKDARHVLRLQIGSLELLAQQNAKGIPTPRHLTPDPGQQAKILRMVVEAFDLLAAQHAASTREARRQVLEEVKAGWLRWSDGAADASDLHGFWDWLNAAIQEAK